MDGTSARGRVVSGAAAAPSLSGFDDGGIGLGSTDTNSTSTVGSYGGSSWGARRGSSLSQVPLVGSIMSGSADQAGAPALRAADIVTDGKEGADLRSKTVPISAFRPPETCDQVLNVDGPAVADTDDFDGSPPGKDSQQISHRWFWQKQTTFWRTNVYVLWFKLMEKIFYDTFSSTQRTTFVQLFGYSNADASSLSSVFGTIAFLTPLLGGWLGDSIWGRYKTILIAAIIYIIGDICVTVSVVPGVDSAGLYIFGAFVLIALGSGCIRPNLATLGADQYQAVEEKEEQKRFFVWYALTSNISSVVAYAWLIPMATTGTNLFPQEWNYFAALAISTGLISIGFVGYLIPTRRYSEKEPEGNSLKGLFYYINCDAKQSWRGKFALSGWVMTVIFVVTTIVKAFITNDEWTQILSYVCLGMCVYACTVLILTHRSNESVRAIAAEPSGALSPTNAEAILDLIPVIVILSVGWPNVGSYMQSSSCQMDLMVGGTQVSAVSFAVAKNLAGAIALPLLELLYAYMAKMGRKKPSVELRITLSMILMAISIFLDAMFEVLRRNSTVTDIVSNCAPPGVTMSEFSSFYMFVSYAVWGVSEALFGPAFSDLLYRQAPASARSIVVAFNMFFFGSVGGSLNSSITLALGTFYPDNLNDGHLEYLYVVYLLIVMGAIPIFLWLMKDFHDKNFDGAEKPAESAEENTNGVDASEPESSLGDETVTSGQAGVGLGDTEDSGYNADVQVVASQAIAKSSRNAAEKKRKPTPI